MVRGQGHHPQIEIKGLFEAVLVCLRFGSQTFAEFSDSVILFFDTRIVGFIVVIIGVKIILYLLNNRRVVLNP
jgi:hypothetical protein